MEVLALLGTRSEITLYSKEWPKYITVNGEPVHYRISKESGERLKIFLDRELSAFDRINLELHSGTCRVLPGEILDNPMYYYEGPLGYSIVDDEIYFYVWAPGPHRVFLEIYETHNLAEPVLDVVMEHDKKGVWSASAGIDKLGCAYRYRIERFETSYFSVDPYAPACTVNSSYSYIIDVSKTNPEEWDRDFGPDKQNPTDVILYEAHISDITANWSSGAARKRKYISLTNGTKNSIENTTGLDHIAELGVTHLHLLPIQDFQSLDEIGEGFNWGYDPILYNIPEGIYSTEPEVPENRITEVKKMVKRIHDSGLGVIMDVVYNHTYNMNSPYHKLVPFYYYRLTDEGLPSNGSGTGNELATEKPMVRRFIIDSLKMWIKEYHIDGFRFDLMGLMGLETMKFIASSLKEEKEDIIIYGEPWMAGPSTMKDFPFFKGCQRGTNISVFNDNLRNALKGFPDDDSRGFVSGSKGKEIDICRGVAGEISFNPLIKGFADEPHETINYCSAHDNLTLFDKITKSNPDSGFEDKKRMAALTFSIILTSQGIPFIHSGSEFLRSKFLERDSYNMGYPINEINYLRKFFYKDFYDYVSGLILLRKSESLFRIRSADEIRKRLSFLQADDGIVAFKLGGNDREIVVIYNSTPTVVSFELQGAWNLLAHNCKIQIGGLFRSPDRIDVEPISASIAINR